MDKEIIEYLSYIRHELERIANSLEKIEKKQFIANYGMIEIKEGEKE